MAAGRPKTALVLAHAQREELERWTRHTTTAQALALRAQIILASAAGRTNLEAAERLGVTHQTVGKWRARFLERRCDGWLDEPRPGAPRKVAHDD